MSDFDARFGGIHRLYGRNGLERLHAAHVAVIGVGGVGSWTAEALARSGIGRITMIDADEVCISNVNRQLPALDGDIGVAKVEALAKRMRLINPEVELFPKQEFFTAETADTLLGEEFQYVVDAIDTLPNKALLVAECRRRNLRVITSGGAGGKKDGTAVRVTDLAHASHDPLLQKLRKKLRAEFAFPGDPKLSFGIPAVYSSETPTPPESCEEGLRIDCNSGYGAVSFVTGAFGLAAAGWVVNCIGNSNR